MLKEIKTNDCIVAFIDILGAKALINSDVDGSLNVIHTVFDKSLEMYNDINESIVNFDYAVFSDNIVIGCKITDKTDVTKAFSVVMYLSSYLQRNFLFYGILTRGGICRGSFFKDSTMVWGKGLIKAYELESSVAIFPRIVIDPELIGQIGFYQEKNNQIPKMWLKVDIDGIVFIDYLNGILIKKSGILLKELEAYDHRVIDCNNDTKIMQKNIWQLNYVKSKLLGGDSNA